MTSTIGQALLDVAGQFSRPSGRAAWRADLAALPRVLRWALPWAVLGRVSRDASPLRWVERWASERPNAAALEDAGQKRTFAQVRNESLQRAAALAAQGVSVGDRVAVLLPTSAELVMTILACWALGAVPCPIDPELPDSQLNDVLVRLEPKWLVGSTSAPSAANCNKIAVGMPQSEARVSAARLPASAIALILPTSGSEGTLKLCRITAGRLALSGHAFGGLALACRQGDVIYCPLPLHHATGIAVALMPALVHGVALHLAGKFSTTRFWQDVTGCGATHLVYVGELLRFALSRQPNALAMPTRLRRVVGNGLDQLTWRVLVERFPSVCVIEFYGATEAPTVLLNLSRKVGSIGRIPLRRLSRFEVVRSDESGGSFTRCVPGEVGELWIRLPRGRRPWLGDFEGYLFDKNRQRAVIANVFLRGDRYYRTYDLVRYDEDDFLYFVDRMGDVWRKNGHNVSTIWLAAELRSVDGIEDALVVPVALDNSSRRFGLAVVVASGLEWRVALEAKIRALPGYARPHLVQVVRALPRTATYKPNKGRWREASWAPSEDSATATYVWRDGLTSARVGDWGPMREALLRE